MDERTDIDIRRGQKLKIGAIAAPVLLPMLPAVITLVLLLLVVSSPPVAVVVLFAGAIATALGLIIGLGLSFMMARRRSVWTNELRERIAANGIRAQDVDWFRNEMRPAEKRALKAIESRDLLLADAYRETLASRLTATRIVRSSKRELLYAKRRQGSLKQLKTQRSEDFQSQIAEDIEKISGINEEARLMLSEAEARLQMIEAAAARGGSLADNEIALKKLSARTSQLPLALEAAKMADEIRLELESEDVLNDLK
ncbi:MAG: hypothetical protein AB7J13_07100 [Pyrinomonadaceae bacterium]